MYTIEKGEGSPYDWFFVFGFQNSKQLAKTITVLIQDIHNRFPFLQLTI